MGKLTLILTMLLVCWGEIHAQVVSTNIDTKTLQQILLNTSLQEGVEMLHNQQVDTIRKKQNRLMALTSSLATYKNLYMVTLENAKGFGVESGIYKSIVASSISIVEHSAQAIEDIMKTNLTGKAVASVRISGMLTQAAHLGNLFFNIVNNAEIPNPMASKMTGAETPRKDKLNLLNRFERLKMAIDISIELKKIDHDLIMIIYYCRHNSLSDLLFHIDRKTWVNYHYANFSSKQLIDKWNSLVK